MSSLRREQRRARRLKNYDETSHIDREQPHSLTTFSSNIEDSTPEYNLNDEYYERIYGAPQRSHSREISNICISSRKRKLWTSVILIVLIVIICIGIVVPMVKKEESTSKESSNNSITVSSYPNNSSAATSIYSTLSTTLPQSTTSNGSSKASFTTTSTRMPLSSTESVPNVEITTTVSTSIMNSSTLLETTRSTLNASITFKATTIPSNNSTAASTTPLTTTSTNYPTTTTSQVLSTIDSPIEAWPVTCTSSLSNPSKVIQLTTIKHENASTPGEYFKLSFTVPANCTLGRVSFRFQSYEASWRLHTVSIKLEDGDGTELLQNGGFLDEPLNSFWEYCLANETKINRPMVVPQTCPFESEKKCFESQNYGFEKEYLGQRFRTESEKTYLLQFNAFSGDDDDILSVMMSFQ